MSYIIQTGLRRETRWWYFHFDILIRKSRVIKSIFSPYWRYLTFYDLWSLNYWPEVKYEVILAKEGFKRNQTFFQIVSSSHSSWAIGRCLAACPDFGKFAKIWPNLISDNLIFNLRQKMTEIVSSWFFTSYSLLAFFASFTSRYDN